MPFDWENINNLNSACNHGFNNKFMSDLEFQFPCGNKIYAHRLLLAISGEGFYNAFKNSVNVITVDDISYETFYKILKSIYNSELEISVENCWDILKVATRYGMHSMRAKSTEFIIANIYVSTVVIILKLSLREKFTVISNHCLCYISANAKKVFNDPSFCEAELSAVTAILGMNSMDDIEMTEFEIFKAVMKWAQRTCRKSYLVSNGATKRSLLKVSTIKLIRFPAMNESEFEECIKMEPGLLEDNEIASIMSNYESKQQRNKLGFLTYKRFNRHRAQKREIIDHRLKTKVKILCPVGREFSFHVTFMKAIELTAMEYYGTNGVFTVSMLADQDTEIFRESVTVLYERIWIMVITPPIQLHAGVKCKIRCTFAELEPDGVVGYEGNNPNILALYYND